MLRWWAGISIALAVCTTCVCSADAQVVAVAETSPESADASAALIDMIGAEARHVDPPGSVTDPDALLAWPLAPDVQFGAIIALDVRRIFVVIPAQHRMLELVLPAEVSSADDYAVALAASELLELANWGGDDVADSTAGPADTVPEETTEESDDMPPPETPTPVHIRHSLSVGAQGWLGVPLDLAQLQARIAYEIAFADTTWALGHPFAEVAIAGFGRDVERSVVATAPFERTYAREEIGFRFGLAYTWRRLELRPFGAASLDWVRVRARRDGPGASHLSASDDRAAVTLGAGLELRTNLGDRIFLSASLAAEALLGRTPYTALGQRIIDEPYVRFVGRLGIGITLPKR